MKAWFGFAAIAGIGFGVGFFAGERFGRKKEAEKMNEIVAPEPTQPLMPQAVQQAVKEYAGEDIDTAKKEMDAYLAQFESPEEDDVDEEEQKPEKKKISSDSILVVGEDVWDLNVDYDPVELKYYDVDEVVTDEFDQRIDDAEDSIGDEVLGIFNQYSDIEEQYVQNSWTMEIFHITRVHDAYASAVLGLDDYEFYHADCEQ